MPPDLMPSPPLSRAPTVAPTAAAVPVPPIPACRAWAARYAGGHGKPLDLTQAVPGWPPHPDMLAALARAAGDPAAATYGLLEGESALREALAEEMRLLYGGDARADDLRITAGANIGFNLAMTVATAPGDEVLLPTPWFFNHEMALALRGVRAVPLPCRAADGFLPDPERAAALVGPRTRAIVLVTPNNPTGAVMPPDLVGRFADLCRERGLWLVLDETYRDFLPEGQDRPHDLFRRPDWRDFVVQLYSFSKAYCIPGHRVGAVCAGPVFRAEFVKAVDNIQICPPRPPQFALAWGVPALREWRAGNRARIATRAQAFRRALESGAPEWRIDAIGAYFAWVRVPDAAPDSAAAAERLAAERGVVSLPGTVFGPGGERHLRLAFANTGEDAIAEVPERLADLFAPRAPTRRARDERDTASDTPPPPGNAPDRSA
ncbi:aminotransferase [Craurococcus roseus]|uniref:aspartate transaminase n=1 Tax=Craurococcus roseus TaxID=77585 RepID=A0ABP3R6Q1_9PROT